MKMVLLGTFSDSEIKYVEECAENLPARTKPYVFVKRWGEIWWKVNA